MNLFDEIKTGLNEAIEYENGNCETNTTRLSTDEEGKNNEKSINFKKNNIRNNIKKF
jgi:hypothetical protein